ncbi:MAG: dTMP kinase [Planctomycetaceae bacterium]|nr:dTMP kinase [Planctomycetaceae bacterium]
MFITIDGGDGSGKTTQQRLLYDWLQSLGREVVLCRDPGGTRLGDKVREIVLGDGVNICGISEMFLFMTARAQLIDEVIRPALDAGKDVIADRFLVSNIVYQGYAGGMAIKDIELIGNVATGGIKPDVAIILDIPCGVSVERTGGRARDRMERKGEEFHQKVRDGFLDYAKKNPEYVVLDAISSIGIVEESIRNVISSRLGS